MPTIEDMIKSSSCFGLAYDETVNDCQICEVRLKCESKCRLGQVVKPAPIEIATPQEITSQSVTKANKPGATVLVVPNKKPTKPTKKPTKPPTKKTSVNEKTPVNYSPDMPADFKEFDMDQLQKMAKERGCDMSEFDKYKSQQILRMRLTMAIKKTYEI